MMTSVSQKNCESNKIRDCAIWMQEGVERKSVHVHSIFTKDAKYDDVYISPSFVEFTDAIEGVTYSHKITIQNRGNRIANIRIGKPNSIAFQVKSLGGREISLSPGLSLSTLVTYTFKRPALLRMIIPIEINGHIFDFHVVSTIATEHIFIEPQWINFRTVDIGHLSGIRLINVYNDGGRSTRFSIDLGRNDLNLTVKPKRGIVGPGKKVRLKVELVGIKEGYFNAEFWIKSTPNIRVPVTVNVIIPKLIVYHFNSTGDFALIDFPTTIENTCKRDTFVLRNISSQTTSYIVFAEVDNELKTIKDIDRKKYPVYNAFSIHPVEGKMDPFEAKIFSIEFYPKTLRIRNKSKSTQQHLIHDDNDENDYMAFIRIMRVGCIETENDVLRVDHVKDSGSDDVLMHKLQMQAATMIEVNEKTSGSSTTSIDSGVLNIVKICFYGNVEVARLQFQPDALYLGDLFVGETVERVIRVTNATNNSHVTFRCVPHFALHFFPKEKRLKPKDSVEVLVKAVAKENLTGPSIFIFFDLIADSYCSLTGRKCQVKIRTYPIECFVNVSYKCQKEPSTKFVTGLTPMITHEVGLNTSKATFGSRVRKPRQAMLSSQLGTKRPWTNSELIDAKIIADTLPAYPNDTSQSLRPYRGPPVTSIFTGKLRFPGSPNYSETFTTDELFFKEKESNKWINYIREVLPAARRQHRSKDLENYFHSDLDADTLKKIDFIPKWKEKPYAYRPSCFAVEKTLVDRTKDEVLVPLTPLQIYNVHISPVQFDFGEIAPKSSNYKQLTLENKNKFPVMIRLKSLTKNIDFPEGSVVIMKAKSYVTRLLRLRRNRIGKFNSYIDYILNDQHSFELRITATVIYKRLDIDKREILFNSEFFPEEAYRPLSAIIEMKNKLNAKTSFKWELPHKTCFNLEPSSGYVRGNSIMYVYMFYKLDLTKLQSSEIVMKCVSFTDTNIRVRVPFMKPKVEFINDTLELGEIPLNLLKTSKSVLHNLENMSVIFEVDPSSLFRGITVHPMKGELLPRGICILEIQLKFDVCFEFTRKIDVRILNSPPVQLTLRGCVRFPELRLSPSRIDAKRISADAFQSYIITAINTGTTVLKLSFPLKDYPEFRASLSLSRKAPSIAEDGIELNPESSQSFYVHFQPVDVASYTFYLPIVINDLLGPVVMENPDTLKPSVYLKSIEEHYKDLTDFTALNVPPTLPTILIDCTVAGHIVSFNKLQFEFDASKNKMDDRFIVHNKVTPREVSIIIRIDEFHDEDCPFHIRWLDGVEPTITEMSVICRLHLGEYSSFIFEFKPRVHGDFNIMAPIFVRGELKGDMFNKLRLDGKWPISTIESDTTEIYFTPVPLYTLVEERFKLKARYFNKPSTIFWGVSTPDRCSGYFKGSIVNVHFPLGNQISPAPYNELEVRLTFKSETPTSFRMTIIFYDDQKLITHPITIYASADNCSLTTYCYMKFTSIGSNHTVKFAERRVSPSSADRSSSTFNEEEIHSQSTSFKMKTLCQDSNSSLTNVNSSQILEETITEENMLDAYEDAQIYSDEHLFFSMDCKTDVPPPSAKFTKSFIKTPFPNFPTSCRNTEYEKYMLCVLTSAEQWLYSGPFKYTFYPKIPDGITASLSKIYVVKPSRRIDDKHKNPTLKWTYIHVLEALVGPVIYEHTGKIESLPEDDALRVEFVLRIYERMLAFLIAQGAFLAHVSPEFLLNYSDYLSSIRIMGCSSAQPAHCKRRTEKAEAAKLQWIPEAAFESRSTQCWLDVVLQTYKCFVLQCVSKERLDSTLPISFGPYRPSLFSHVPRSSSVQSLQKLTDKSSKQITEYKNSILRIMESTKSHKNRMHFFCLEELQLLAWLQFHFESQRLEQWMTEKRITLNPNERSRKADWRNIENLESDLWDSLPLIAVTAAYCPFLIDECFSHLFVNAKTTEEALHNAICVVNAWERIRLGFMVSPMQIIQGNRIQLLMLVAHLFQVLPTYIPKAKIKFCCPLSETVVREIAFTNPKNCRVDYLLLLMGSKLFSIPDDQRILRINELDSSVIKIQFHARKIKKVTACLLACGNAIGVHFAMNQVLILEGYANTLGITAKHVIKSKLYQVVGRTLMIEPPYTDNIEYEIWMTEECPDEISSVNMTRWSELKIKKIPRRLFINQTSIVKMENVSKIPLPITVACITPSTRSFWLVFQSKLGDFIIQIDSHCQTSLTDRMIYKWNNVNQECICTDPTESIHDECPFRIEIPVPMRNIKLWNCVACMFEKTLDSKERQFWSRYLHTKIGLQLIRWLMEDNDNLTIMEFSQIFNRSVTYKVTTTDKLNYITVPTEFTIPDVWLTGKSKVMVGHISPNLPKIYESSLSLVSLDEKEKRVYAIDFISRS